ncbi:outer membrane lipoprotein carrier protein LolA [Sphingomonas sp. ASV193]|uniref:LolA family protein n=1 Tax=Sphingomonas sp. ASV193 TaxID=3144405 RepID=UPI0032E8665D
MFATRYARFAAPVALVALAAPAPAQNADLARVQQSIAATQSLTANFVQTDGRGRQLRGALSMKRPGKIRFDYGQNADMLLVADGRQIHFLDYSVGQHSRYSIANSPLSALLDANPNLARIATIQNSGSPNLVVIRARDARRPEFGTLVMAFSRNPAAPAGLKLEGWTAIDAQNKRTKVVLSNQRYNVAVPDSAFTFAEPKKRG